jgi:Ser/Thr protein kinase RdoA (MazF antagonist)
MMTLNTMQAVLAATERDGQNPVAAEIASRWEADPGSAQFFRASANFVFKFTRRGKKYVLRFNHGDERTRAGIEAEVAYVNHLARQGLLVARPVPSRQGNEVESVQTPLGLFHGVVFQALAGQQFDLSELTPERFTHWGGALGQLHQASQGYSGTGRPGWQDHLALIAASLPPEEQAARNLLHTLQEQLGQLPTDECCFGLIHYDFELDNLLWISESVGIVDFDDSARYWFAADIAYALRELFDDRPDQVDLGHKDLQRFVQGYRAVRAISQEELERVPLFLKLHNLLSFAKLDRALRTPVPPDAPGWVTALGDKLRAKMNSYRHSFSEDMP